MAIGHVKLGDYELKMKGSGLPTQVLANQMAPKIGTTEGEYSSLDTWSAWIQQSWDGGVGQLNPAGDKSSGTLYSEVDTRVPNQMIMSPRIVQTDLRTLDRTKTDCRNWPTDNNLGQAGYQFAIRFTTPAAFYGTYARFWVYMDLYGHTCVPKVYTNSADAPNTLVDTGTTLTGIDQPGFAWYIVDNIEVSGLSTATDYWLVLESTDQVHLGKGHASYTGGYLIKSTAGGAWAAASAGVTPAWSSNLHSLRGATLASKGEGFFYLNSTQYYYGNGRIYKYSAVNDAWSLVGAISGTPTITGAVVFNSVAYLGVYGGNYVTMNTSETISIPGTAGHVFGKSGQYLYRAVNNTLYYSADGSSWTGPFTMCDSTFKIRSIAGLGQSIYCAADDGLYALMPGDFPIAVAPWGSEASGNGVSMINHQGDLYAAANRRLYRISEDGSMQDVFVGTDDDVQYTRSGRVWDVKSLNNQLIAIVGDGGYFSSPYLIAYQNGGWHSLGVLPPNYTGSDSDYPTYGLYYDRPSAYLWIACGSNTAYRMYVPDYAINPYNDPDSDYAPGGWVEWDWFYGPIREAEKDFESVTLTGEFSASLPVQVWYMEGDGTAWTLLGTVTADAQELRWSIADRPCDCKIKLGLYFVGTDDDTTPLVRSVRLKYHTMTADWFRWTLPVDVSGGLGGSLKQEMIDGERRSETAAQLKTALDGIAAQTAPLVYRDVDGTYYEVKVTDASFNYTEVSYNRTAAVREWEGVYTLTVEQVTQGTYTPP